MGTEGPALFVFTYASFPLAACASLKFAMGNIFAFRFCGVFGVDGAVSTSGWTGADRKISPITKRLIRVNDPPI